MADPDGPTALTMGGNAPPEKPSTSGDASPASGIRPDPVGMAPPPFFYPAAIPSFFQEPLPDQNQPQGGVFAIPVLPYFEPMAGYPPGGLISLSLNSPMGPAATSESGGAAGPSASGQAETGRSGRGSREVAGQEGLRHRHAAPGMPGQGARPQVPREVVIRVDLWLMLHLLVVAVIFHDGSKARLFLHLVVAAVFHRYVNRRRPEVQREAAREVVYQLDLFVTFKLLEIVVVFINDGSTARLFLNLFLAILVQLYRIGALSRLLRRISRSAQRAMMPPPQPGA